MMTHVKYNIVLIFVSIYSVYGLPNWAWDFGWYDKYCMTTVTNVSEKIQFIGRYRTAINNNSYDYCAYLGIPYAMPPTGNRRFKPPEPYLYNETNKYVRARDLGEVCVQRNDKGEITGSEDCLFLNIYTPNIDTRPSNKYPVMFFIHGGSFNSGSGSYKIYGPDYLVSQDVILVTFNYRLGVFGFLSNPDWEIYGNMGLKDQRLALKWIHENIESFGGDKDRITIFGESAGAASVHYLMMDNSTSKYYARAILQSGSAPNPWAVQIAPKKRFDALKNALNLTKESLQNKDYKEIITAAEEKVPTENDTKHATKPVFNPVVENNCSVDPIVTKHLLNRTKQGHFPNKDIIIGFNNAEGLLAMNRVQNESSLEANNTLNDVRRVIPIFYNNDNYTIANKSVKALAEYYKNVTGKNNPYEGYIQLMGDAWFLHGINRTITAISEIPKENRTAKMYVYRLSDSSYSVYKKYLFKNEKWKNLTGVCHTDDLGYLFSMCEYPLKYFVRVYAEIPEEAQETHKKMVTLWTNFAKTGNPLSGKRIGTEEGQSVSAPSYGNLTGIQWDEYNNTNRQYLEMNHTQFYMTPIQEEKRMDLWYNVYKEYKNETTKNDNEETTNCEKNKNTQNKNKSSKK